MRRIRQIARRVAQFLFAETTSPAGRQCCEPLESRTLLTVPYGTLNFNFENTHTVTAVFTDQPNGQGQPVNVSPSLINEDLSLERDVGTDTFVPAAQIALSYSGTNPATFSFSGFGPQHIPPSVRPEILPNGNYRASISKQDVLNGTDEMAADALLDFFVLAGDANRNRLVSLPDYNILAANFGQTNRTFSQGNFDYDPGGNVNQADYDVLAAHFGATVPVPPTAPNEIVVGFATSSTLTVQWLDNVVGETGFRIQQSADGQIFDVYYNYPATPALFESFIVPNLQDGKRYWFRVRAYSDPIENPNGPNTAYTPKRAANTVLPAPTNIAAAPLSPSQIRVIWSDRSQNESSFQVYRSLNPTSGFVPVGSPIPSGAPTQFTDNGLTPNTTYYYYILAQNAVTTSAPSTNTNATTPLQAFPIILTATAASETQVNFTISGTVSGASEHRLQYSFDGVEYFEASGRDPSFTTSSADELEPGSLYYYRIVASNLSGDLGQSNPVAVITPGEPPEGPAPEGELPPPEAIPTPLLVAFNGARLGGEPVGNFWYSEAITQTGGTINPDQGKAYADNQGFTATVRLLQLIDTNPVPPMTITAQEIANVEVSIAGYSWGSVTAANVAYFLTRRRYAGYTLDRQIPVKRLVLTDPVHEVGANFSWFIRHTKSPVTRNVQKFRSYYHRNKGTPGIIDYGPGGGQFLFTDIWGNSFSNSLIGAFLPTSVLDSEQRRVDTTWANREVIQPYIRPTNPTVQWEGRQIGREVNHDTMSWYTRRDYLADLGVPNPT